MHWWILRTFVFLLVTFKLHVHGLNIMHVTNRENTVAVEAMSSVINYIKSNSPDTTINRYLAQNVEGEDLMKSQVCDLLKMSLDAGHPPHLVVDSTFSGASSKLVKMMTRSLGIPTVSTSYGDKEDIREWSNLTESEMDFLVHIRPPGDLIPSIVRDTVINQDLTNAAIYYDKTFVMEYQYKSLLQNVPCRHIMLGLPEDMNADDISKLLQRTKDAELVNVFVLSTAETASMVANKANSMGMINKQYSWMFISKDIEPVRCSNCANSTFLHVAPRLSDMAMQRLQALRNNYGLPSQPQIDAAFQFDVILRAIMAAMKMEVQGEYPADYQVKYCSEMMDGGSSARASIPLLPNMQQGQNPATVGSLQLMSASMSYMEMTLLVSMLKFIASSLVSQDTVGHYSVRPNGGMFQDLDETMFISNRAVTVYRIVVVVQPPFVYKDIVNGEPVFSGYCLDMLYEVQKEMGFEYELYEAPDGKYGFMDDNGNWNGAIKEIIDKNAHIALGAISLMAEREAFVDFTTSYYDLVGITILMRKPRSESALFRFLTVLESEVWGSIVAAYFATSVLLWFFDRLSPYSFQNNQQAHVDDEEKRVFSFKESLWFCITSLTPQGGGEAPKCMSGRLVVGTWWLFGFIVIASYTANLAAFLTVSRLETQISTLDQLYRQFKIEYAPMNDSVAMQYFKRRAYIEDQFYEVWKRMSLNTSASVLDRAKLAVWHYPVSDMFVKMWEAMQATGLPPDYETAIQRVLASPSGNEGFAYFDEETVINYQVMTSCDFVSIGEPMSRKPYALAVQKGSPLRQELSMTLLKLLNERKLELLKEKWWTQNPYRKFCDDESSESDGISISNIGGVFIVIFVGMALALMSMGFEYWYYKASTPKDKQVTPGHTAKVAAWSAEPELPQKPTGSDTNFG